MGVTQNYKNTINPGILQKYKKIYRKINNATGYYF